MTNNTLLIGIDGGATKISARNVIFNEKTNNFSLGEISADYSYNKIKGYIPDFKPVDITTQLNALNNNSIEPTESEKKQGEAYVLACAKVIETIVKQSETNQIIAGLGMPGLKTADKRGIAVIANGPRMINFADNLEKKLENAGINFISPIARIGSDADYCGIGENFSENGLFKNVKNAYYLGGGTSVADAMKLNGNLIPFDETKSWAAKTWELKSPDGYSLERFTSVGGLQAVYAEFADKPVSELNEKGIYPLQIAELSANGNPYAKKTINLAVENISLLLFDRITTLFSGSQNIFDFVNPNRSKLSSEHPYLSSVFDRIIIGQRLGELFESPYGKSEIKKPVITRLSYLVQKSSVLSKNAKLHYKNLNKIIVSSKLREAPIIGAAVDAYLIFKNK